MSGIFPLREKVDLGDDRDPRLIDLDEDVADEVFDALSSRTTREIFAQLHASPQTASDLAEVTDTSVQNAQYHLEKLVAADLVEVVDTWYSERGTEMKVYAPTDESLVLFAGRDKEGTLRTLLRRVVGVLAVLLPVSAVVAWLADRFAGGRSGPLFQGDDGAGAGSGDAGDAGSVESTEATPRPTEQAGNLAERNSGDGITDADGGDGGGSDSAATSGGGDGGGTGGDGAVGDAGTGGGDTPVPTEKAPTPDAETLDVTTNETLQTTNGTELNGTTPAPEATEVAEPTTTPTAETTEAVADATATPVERATEFVADVTATPTPASEATDATVQATAGLDPALLAGLSFFLGGVFVLALVGVAWYWR